MDSPAPGLDFAVIGHQDSWQNIAGFLNAIRTPVQGELPVSKIREIFSFIPPRDLFRVKVRSTTGAEINGVYIESFIDPDKLDTPFIRNNLGKVSQAIAHAKKLGAAVVTLGGFTSIVLEGELASFSQDNSRFTTGNTLTASFIAKGVEKAAALRGIQLNDANMLIVGATGDIGKACVSFFRRKVKKLLLNARNNHRLCQLSQELSREGVPTHASVDLKELVHQADVIISVASSSGIRMNDCQPHTIICDAGYPKNIVASTNDNGQPVLFHGGMGQVSGGYIFNPDYSENIYRYPAPNVIHGCILEAMVLAFEGKYENYSAGKGRITVEKMEEIYAMSIKHGINISPFFNADGLWRN